MCHVDNYQHLKEKGRAVTPTPLNTTSLSRRNAMSLVNSITEVEYRELPEFPGYRFGSDGSVWSRKRTSTAPDGDWRQLKTTATRKGYRQVNLVSCDHKVTRFVHVLVLTAFVGPKPEGMECAHDNGVRHDNRLTNLAWKTPVGNWDDRRRHGTQMEGVDCHSAKLDDDKVGVIKQRIAAGEKHADIAADYGVHKSAIGHIARGKTWKHVRQEAIS